MPAPRPTMALNKLKRSANANVSKRTDCKICRLGIYRDQPYRWLTNPMGLSHDECAKGRGLL